MKEAGQLECNRFNRQSDESEYRAGYDRIFSGGHDRFSEPMTYIPALDKWVTKRDSGKYTRSRAGMMFIDKSVSADVTYHMRDNSRCGAPEISEHKIYRKF